MKKPWLIFIVIGALILAGAAFLYWWTGCSVEYVAATPASHTVVYHKDLAYRTDQDANPNRNQLDLFLPEGATQTPVVIILHGGGWSMGSHRLEAIQAIAQWFAERGVIAAPMGYRLVPHVRVLDQAADIATGAAWVYRRIAEYGGNPEKIFFLGHSAGGHLAALATCNQRYLKRAGLPDTVPAGVIALASPMDLRTGMGSHPMSIQMTKRVFGDDKKLRANSSPLRYVRPNLPPFLLCIGKGDHVVPHEQIFSMAEALKQAGVFNQVMDVSGRGHIEVFHQMIEPGDVVGEAALAFILSH